MRTDVMISQLRREAKKHENDKLQTFDTNITAMCTDVANRLEELENENKEIRAKAIDEFAENIGLEISESIVWDMLATMNKNSSLSDTSDKIVDYVIAVAKKIAEQMKGDGENENRN